MSKKLGRVYYALIDRSIGDTLSALVTVSTDLDFMVSLSRSMYAYHLFQKDFIVVRSAEWGYFRGKAVTVAVNGKIVS